MYDAGVTQQKVEELARAANWQPEYHSPETCQAARRFFQDLTQHDAKGRPQGFKRALSRSESEWIANERRLCKLDFNYFATRYAYIRHWNTSLTLFDPNLPQRIKLAGYAEQEARGVAIMALNLKARQHGSSTLDELICGHRATFWAQTYSIVGSSDPEKSRKMFNMVELMWEHMPWWLKPEITSYSAGERVEFGKMNSIISIQHGTQTSDIGRGDTPNVIHLSELNDFDRPGELIDAGLMRAIHQSPSIFMILECTGTGRGTWWHKKWESCVADGEYAQFTPTFLPWFLGTDKYPTPDWLKRYPIREDWRPQEQTLAHAERCAEYVSSTPLLRRHLGEGWTLPREQQWFYELDRARYVREGKLGLFLREMPATPDEAFASVNEQIFSIELMDTHRARVRAPQIVRITGSDIPQRILPGRPASTWREASVNWQPGDQPRIGWKFQNFGEAQGDNFSPHGWLLLWEGPRSGEEYAIGIDCSEGIGQDSTVISVVKRGAPGSPDEQVGEWSHNRASGLDAWSVALALSVWYSCGGGSTVTVVPELAKDGPALVNEMKKRGWRRWHQRRSWTKLGASSLTQQIGWQTTATSRPRLVGHLIQAVRDDFLMVRNRWLLSELEDLEDHNGKVEARDGAHDDRVIATALAVLELQETEQRGVATRRQQARAEREAEDAVEAEWTPPAAALGVVADNAMGWIGEV